MKNRNINTTPLVTEIHKKLALAFSSFIFVLIGLPIAINTRRREKSVAFGLSLVIILTYYAIFIGGKALALKEKVPVPVGIWSADIIFLLIGLILILKTAEH